jgi:hypothetical protein
MMKRRDLEKALRLIAKDRGVDFEVVREGGKHTIVRVGDKKIPIPRHAEINEITAHKIIEQAEEDK